MCVQYIGGCSVHWGDSISTLGGYHECIVGVQFLVSLTKNSKGKFRNTMNYSGVIRRILRRHFSKIERPIF